MKQCNVKAWLAAASMNLWMRAIFERWRGMLCDLIVLGFFFQPSQDIKKETNSSSLLSYLPYCIHLPKYTTTHAVLFFGYHLLSENEEKTNVCQLFCKKWAPNLCGSVIFICTTYIKIETSICHSNLLGSLSITWSQKDFKKGINN